MIFMHFSISQLQILVNMLVKCQAILTWKLTFTDAYRQLSNLPFDTLKPAQMGSTHFWRIHVVGSTHLHHAYTENPVWILKYAEIFLIVMDSENNWIIVHWLLPPIEIEVRGFMNHNRRSVNNNTSNGQIFFLLFCRPQQNVNPTMKF